MFPIRDERVEGTLATAPLQSAATQHHSSTSDLVARLTFSCLFQLSFANYIVLFSTLLRILASVSPQKPQIPALPAVSRCCFASQKNSRPSSSLRPAPIVKHQSILSEGPLILEARLRGTVETFTQDGGFQ